LTHGGARLDIKSVKQRERSQHFAKPLRRPKQLWHLGEGSLERFVIPRRAHKFLRVHLKVTNIVAARINVLEWRLLLRKLLRHNAETQRDCDQLQLVLDGLPLVLRHLQRNA
jgi:hypothetical protein